MNLNVSPLTLTIIRYNPPIPPPYCSLSALSYHTTLLLAMAEATECLCMYKQILKERKENLSNMCEESLRALELCSTPNKGFTLLKSVQMLKEKRIIFAFRL